MKSKIEENPATKPINMAQKIKPSIRVLKGSQKHPSIDGCFLL